ncbi:MAG: FliO/MopB family protein [Anaerolineae bacterium]|nr:FliO/MopB family protein [Phycisphaerae bacterium]
MTLLLLLTSTAHAQSTQPAAAAPDGGAFDTQPIKRSLKTANSASTPTAQTFDWQRLCGALGIVLGLIFVLKFVIGKIYPSIAAGAGSRVVRVLARSPIAPKQQVMLLHIGRRIVVVGDSGGQLSTLCDIADADEVAALLGQIDNQETAVSPRRAFNAMFGRARKEFDPPAESIDSSDDPSEIGESSKMDPDMKNAQTEISGLIDRMRTLTRVVRRED